MPFIAPDDSARAEENMTSPARYKMVLIAAVLVMFLFVAFVLVLQQNPTVSSLTDADRAATIHQVQVVKPQRRDIARTITIPGNISPMYQATVYAKVSGYLKSIAVDKGDEVKKGQLLAVIEAPEVEDEYQQAVADYTIKRITAQRLHSVWEENPDVVARQDVDVAQAAAEAARHVRDTRRQFLDYTKVEAMFSGTVTARFVDPGAFVQSAVRSATQSTPLVTMMDLENVRVYVNVPQEAAMLAKEGVPAVLKVPGSQDRELKGSITRTTEVLDQATRTLLVEIDLPNKDRVFQPGMFIQVTLFLEQHPQAIVIPPDALVSNNGGKAVFVIEEGRARVRSIELDIDDGGWVEVVNGLTGHEDIVVVGKAGLTDGTVVNASGYNLPEGKPSHQKY